MKGIVLDDRALVMTRTDSVATAIEDLEPGESIERQDGTSFVVSDGIPFGHKVALTAFERGDSIQKYGEIIGRATESIDAGDWVHTHNVESTRGRGDRAAGGTE